MTACPSCHAAPVLEQTPHGWRYVCPNANRVTGRRARDVGACPNWTPKSRITPESAAAYWERSISETVHTTPRERAAALTGDHCLRCGLREPHVCLHASGADRDAGSRQWWAGRKAHRGAYTDGARR